jgi:alkylation response protein AidB-like acyl-CoA dehydrogenase
MAGVVVPSSLVGLARDRDEEAFVADALAFLEGLCDLRLPESNTWGEGPENLTIFHETSGEEELKDVATAKRWQATKWEHGFGWITGPVIYGGRGLSPRFQHLYRAVEAAFDVADLDPLRIGLSTVGPGVLASGTEAQVRRFVVPIQRGTLVACQLFSEPEAGSDLANVRTRAVRDGEVWRLTGQKVWTSNAQFADIGLALVRSDEVASKHKGLTVLLVPMSAEGVEVRPLRQMTGGASFNEVFLDDVVVPDDLRLGGVGEGWAVATRTLTAERTSVGERSNAKTGRALALLQALSERAGLSNDPVVRQQLADVAIRLRVAAIHQSRMQAVPIEQMRGPERSLDKLMYSENLRRMGEVAAAITGPKITADVGEWGTYAWSAWLLGAPGYRLGGGTDEVLKNLIAERLLDLPRGN